MRISQLAIVLLIFCQISLAQNVNAIKISESFEEASLAKVLRVLKNKYDLKIAYDDALITGTTISGTYVDRPVTAFLESILKGKGIDFQLLNNKIILVPLQVAVDVNSPSLFDITVFGLVQDATTGESLPNALVSIGGLNRGVITNKDGYFSLPRVPTDTSTIVVNYLGYEQTEVKLKPGDNRQTLKITMQESALDLSDFTVIENKFTTVKYGDEISQITIDPKNLSSLPNLGELDLFRSLQFLPGIGGTDETSSALSIRNSPSAHNLVLFDGFTVYRLDHFFGVFSAINADAVRDIQIYKGGFGAKYGGRVSGVVDITGTTGNFNEPSYSLGLNLMSARLSANLPFASGRGAIHISGRRAYTDIIRSNLFEKLYNNYRDQSNQVSQQAFAGAQNNADFIRPDFHFFDFNLKASYKLSTRDILSLSYYQGKDDLETDFDIINQRDPNDPSTIDQIDSYQEIADWGNIGVGLIWSRNWNTRFYSTFQAAYSEHFFDYFYNNQRLDNNGSATGLYEISRANEVSDLQFNFKNELSIGNRHNINFGISHSEIDVLSEVNIRDLSGTQEGDQRDPTRNGNILSFYASDNIYFTKDLQIRFGGRMNTTNVSDQAYFSPRLAMLYQLSPSLELKASTGKYFQIMREEVFDDPFSNNENGWNLAQELEEMNVQNLPVMEADHYIVGFQYEKEDLTFDVEYYQKDVSGLTEYNISHLYDPNTQLQAPNVIIASGSSRIEGIDVLFQKRVGPYQGWLAYTRSKAINRYDDINNNEYFPAREDQRNELKIVNILELSKWNFSTTWIYGSGRPFYRPVINFIRNNQNEIINYEVINNQKIIERLPNYNRFDVSAAYKFENETLNGEIGLSILNIFNHTNIQSKRLRRYEIERAIGGDPNATLPDNLYRDVVLLDFTPSIFLNLNF